MSTPLGGGASQRHRVRIGTRKEQFVTVRVGIWGVRSLGVVISREHAGRFLVYNHDVGRWQIVGSVFLALRQVWHILAKYGKDIGFGEKEKMARAARLARELNLQVLGLGSGTSIAAMRTATRAAVVEASQQLGAPRKLTKRQALEHLHKLESGSDSRGRPNPGVLMARAVSSREAILARLEREILEIQPQIFRRQQVLLQMIQYAEQVILYGVRDFLDRILAGGNLARVADPLTRAQVAQHCCYLAADLERLDFNPYRETCSQTAADFRSAVTLLRQRDALDDARLSELRQVFERCRSAMLLKSLQLKLERVLYRLMRENGHADSKPGRLLALVTSYVDVLGRVDETGFRKPVRAAAGERLAAAAFALQLRNLPLAKQELKACSEQL